jgi:2OG-Fe(II) oxygenase superfamily
MNKHQKINDGRNCWKTARERERLKARFDIRERVSSLHNETARDRPKQVLHEELSGSESHQLHCFLRQIEAGAVSAFSLSRLATHISLLDMSFPCKLLSGYKINTLCTSRFGKEYTVRVLLFVAERETCTIMEYVSLLGEYKILGSLLVGGVDPTRSGYASSHAQQCDERLRSISPRVMQRFFDVIPLSLKAYIVKRVVDMRVAGLLDMHPSTSCTICQSDHSTLLSFGPPCQHIYCETCFWDNLLEHLDHRSMGNVIRCPSCGKSNENELAVSHAHSEIRVTPWERHRHSLAMYKQLPANTKELKSRPKKKNYKKDALSHTWHDAVMRSLGSSMDVRRDKFFSFVERNAYHFVKGCLEEGIDTDLVNEYSQTGLYLASWRGFTKLVQLLLDYGADADIAANGGSTAIDVAEWKGHHTIADMLRRLSTNVCGNAFKGSLYLTAKRDSLWRQPRATTLINPNSAHPGAGSFVIDNTLAPQAIDRLIGLWQVIPYDINDHKQKKNVENCSARHYFCDVEGNLCKNISDAIKLTGICDNALVLSQMRFLHYAHPGSVLAPHVDLCRLDWQSGKRSTHTFILYLVDCEVGGETALLDDLSGSTTLALVLPRRGRMLLFPHSCPHEGKRVVSIPKVLLRGEVWMPVVTNIDQIVELGFRY